MKILNALHENSRMTISEIGKRVNLSIPSVTERIRKMDEAGIIECYTIKINRAKTNYKLLAYVLVTLDRTEHIEGFRNAMLECASVLECHHIAGEYDYLLKVLVEDPMQLERFLSETLKKIPGVQKSNTMITLSTVKENLNIL